MPATLCMPPRSEERRVGKEGRRRTRHTRWPRDWSSDVCSSDLRPGSELLLDDGLMAMRVTRIDGDVIHCEVMTSGRLSDRKGLNLRGGGLSVPGVSEDDARDIVHAAEIGRASCRERG